MSTDPAVKPVGAWVDDRFGAANFFRRNMRKVFPDHWSFMLGEIALYSFVILLLTGVFLTLWFKPSMMEVTYTGSYAKLYGIKMSEAYASTLHISFDVRGGLLMRQIHHWAALIFVGSIMAHMLRIFFTGAFRRPREINWLIGVGLFTLALVEGFAGYSLPDDLLSGIGLRIAQGVIQSIPVVGTYLFFFLFGGEFPGEDFIPRLYTIHVLLIPGIMLALITAHMMILWHQKHTQWPGKGRTEHNVVGAPMYPAFAAKTGAFFFFVFAVSAGLATFAQINPIWLFGPYTPADVTAGAQPDFYIGFLEGGLRIMPSIEFMVFGHNLSLNVLVPGLIVPGILFTGLALWPFIEQWITGDRQPHHLLDRPRNAPTRTAIGMAGVTFYGLLWLAGGNDLIAVFFNVSLNHTTYFFRTAVIVGPIMAYIITKRACLGLQRRDRELLHHGLETGVVKRLPHGEFIEVTVVPSEDVVEHVLGKKELPRLPARTVDPDGIPAPTSRSLLGRVKLRLNRWYTADNIPLDGDHAAVHPETPEITAGNRRQPTEG